MTILPRRPPPGLTREPLAFGMQRAWVQMDRWWLWLALIALAPVRERAKTALAFMLASSLAVVLTGVNLVHVAVPPADATIALALVYAATELVSGPGPRRSRHRAIPPWGVAWYAGLLCGCRFAADLSRPGVASSAPLHLLWFTAGIWAVYLPLASAGLAATAWWSRRAPHTLAKWKHRCAYALGVTASFWCAQRIAAFWS